ncbi:hypothetical protein TSMG0064 [Halocynthia phage JM-2012]|uniref:hypothetical protein n=1 Tax=Halocynthia phage JM-2012 TaxID=1173297 RepID=UPI00025C6914|nr:hypothetical protein TSMG0064 [Halocynthia phage JM-2012]AFI55347.1 hypothetical protein TSMG0064 [Halocynthia phage JM-2012]
MSLAKQLHELKHEQEILNSFCYQGEVGIEAINPKSFLRQLKRMSDKSSALVDKLLSRSEVAIEYTGKSVYALDSKVLKSPFTTTSSNIIYVPVGFTGKMNDFVEFLFAHQDDMFRTGSVLNTANGIFSQYASKPDDLMKVDAKSIPELQTLKEIPSQFHDFFVGQEGNDRAVMLDVYRSYGDFNNVTEYLEKLTKKFSNIKLSEIRKSVNDFYETLDYITTQIDDGNVEVSKQTAKKIGSLIYNLADWVAVYSLYLTKLLSVVNAHKDSAEKLNDLVR